MSKGDINNDNFDVALHPRLTRARILTLALVCHCLVVVLTYRLQDPFVAALFIVPVAVVGWLYGVRGGLIAGLLALPLTTLVLLLLGTPWVVSGRHSLLMTAVLVVVGSGIGRLHDLLAGVSQRLSLRTADLAAANQRLQHELAERQRAEGMLQRQTRLIGLLQQAILSANEATTTEQGLQAVVDQLGRWMEWPIGHAWINTNGRLRSTSLWYLPQPDRYEEFRTATQASCCAPSEDLPGEALAARRPVWRSDVTRQGDFPRLRAAQVTGIKAGFAFPVLCKAQVVAVLEFFAEQVLEPDPAFLEMLSHIGAQLGRVLERQEAQRALRESELRLRSVIQAANDAIILADQDGIILAWNKGAHNIFGYSEGEVRGQPLTRIMPERYRAAHLAGLRRVRESGRSKIIGQTIEIVGLRKDGSEFPIELSLASWETDEGMFFSGIIRDITNRKQAETILREREESLQAVIDASPDIITFYRPDGTVLMTSAAVEKTLGYAAAERRGATSFDIIHPKDRETFVELFQLLLSGAAKEVHSRLRVRHAAGHWLSFESRGRAMYDAEGTLSGILVVSRDISEWVELNSALEQARNDAERANQAKSDFLSRTSHELRTPLNAILGFAQLLQLELDKPAQLESLDHILKGGNHLLELINEVLDISRIESGRLSLSVEPVEAREVIEGALQLVQPLAAQYGIELQAALPAAAGWNVLADRQRLSQVLLNLLSNAIKYNRPGGSVTIGSELVPGDRLRIYVEDTGPGLTPTQLDRIFTPFDRLGAEQSDIEGTGLGLALSQHLIEAMNGTIGVASTAGQGSTFWVELPLSPESELPAASDQQTGELLSHIHCAGHTILIIEDNLANLHLIERLLADRSGIRLLAAMQASLGLELAREHRPDVVLLDLHLPDVSGEVVLRRLREMPETSLTPVVVISADATAHQIDRLLAAGAQAYLTKPLNVHQFLETLDQLLKKQDR